MQCIFHLAESQNRSCFAGKTHRPDIIFEPKTFGLTAPEIQAEFDKHNEKLGHEGWARDAIIRSLFEKGWIRVRFEDYGHLIFQLSKFDATRQKNIINFLTLVRKGIISPPLKDGNNFDVEIYNDRTSPFMVAESPSAAIAALKEFLK